MVQARLSRPGWEKKPTGVSVTLDGEYFSLSPETTEAFFETEVLPRLGK